MKLLARAKVGLVGIVLSIGCGESAADDPLAREGERVVAPTTVTSFALLASGRATLGDRNLVTGGHIGVAPGTGDSVKAGIDARVAQGNSTVGQRIVLRERAKAGDLFATTVVPSAGATYSSLSPYVAPPAQPAVSAFTPGSGSLTVSSPQTLAAGDYGNVTVNSTLTLSGGTYELANLTLGNNATVQASAASLVRVTGRISGGNFVKLQPIGAQPAANLRLVVASTSDATGGVVLGTDARVTGLVIARASFTAADRFTGRGALIARNVTFGNDSSLTFQSGVECNDTAGCNDGNACTTDACTDGKCSHTALANGTACPDEGNGCTTDTCQAGACAHPPVADGTACTNDDNECTTDRCTAGACTHPALPDGTACTADASFCTTDACFAGACAHPALADGTACPDDGNPCTGDACASGACGHAAIPACVASTHPPKPIHVPKPPADMDCGWYTPNGWEALPCATPAQIQAYFSRLEYNPVAVRTESYTEGGMSVTLPLLSGVIEHTFTAVGTMTDVLLDPPPTDDCPAGPRDPLINEWSVQGNSNLFVANNGNNAAVQFAIQTGVNDMGDLINGVCVWNVDGTAQDYSNTFCVIPPPKRRAGALKPFDSSTIIAYAEPADSTLHIIAKMSWVEDGEPYIYTAKSADVFGLIGSWTSFDGDVLGNGNCSQLQFTDTQLATRIAASTCKDDLGFDGSVAACPPPTFKPHGGSANYTVTVETNNLTHIAPPTFPVYYPNDWLAATDYISSTSGACLGPSHVYVSDRIGDNGGQPSNQGGEAFWESPDIFLVPQGTPVTVTGIATQSLLTPGGVYDVYIRVHNDYGCSEVTGTKARIHIADPATLSTSWQPITGDMYLSDAAHPAGVPVPPGESALIGPFTFTAPMDVGDGHKCLIAAIIADGEPAVTDAFLAPDYNQVAQRNLQPTSDCTYPLTNATGADSTVALTLTVTPPEEHASLSVTPDVRVTFYDPGGTWGALWAAQPNHGVDFTATPDGAGNTTVRLGNNRVELVAAPIANGETRSVHATLALANYAPLTTVQVQASLGGGMLLNGMSCAIRGPEPVP